MKIKIEMEIDSCAECPFAVQVCQQGYTATDCSKLGPYATIANNGFRKDCLFLKKNEKGG